MINRIKTWLKNRDVLNIEQFAHRHRDFLVMVCDPRDDTMFMAYRDKIVSGRVSSMDGKNHRVIKNVLRYSTFQREIDRLIGAVVDALAVQGERCTTCKQRINPLLKWTNSFIHFIDGALFNIVSALKGKR